MIVVSDIFKFYNNQCPDYFNEIFCPVDNNGVATRCYNKKLKLPFRKSKLGMQSFAYVEPSTFLRNQVKLTWVSIFTREEKTLESEHNQYKYTFCFYFSLHFNI